MTPTDRADDLARLTEHLTGEGWAQVKPVSTQADRAANAAGISFQMMASPGHHVFLIANWRPGRTITELISPDPERVGADAWRAQADNLPVTALMAAARAATAAAGPRLFPLLRAAGWDRAPVYGLEPALFGLRFADPNSPRSVIATYLRAGRYLERGPWLIQRDDTDLPGPGKSHAHTTPYAPGPVIAALALT
jgi:hypothetical protein